LAILDVSWRCWRDRCDILIAICIEVFFKHLDYVIKDKGDDDQGYGNLCVIERGKYTGGETCLPQYGIGVDVREGDILLMDVHEWHANLPIQLEKGAERMSVVCYLRKKLWERTRNKSRAFMKRHNKTVKSLKAKIV
jgi:hypothetical protein